LGRGDEDEDEHVFEHVDVDDYVYDHHHGCGPGRN
jgi:hypothetical protein